MSKVEKKFTYRCTLPLATIAAGLQVQAEQVEYVIHAEAIRTASNRFPGAGPSFGVKIKKVTTGNGTECIWKHLQAVGSAWKLEEAAVKHAASLDYSRELSAYSLQQQIAGRLMRPCYSGIAFNIILITGIPGGKIAERHHF
ncbi:hypothetical protein [Flaviaesturariibacter amylovorans]|uniref:Uncharacterized protein n=1 Tax=Flaviaesturariibacter amylovorans TaxID=1084520 RepID=A0ABP8GQ24_9BACT